MLQARKEEKVALGLYFEIHIFVLAFILRTLCHFALQVNVSQRLIRHRCLFSDALVRYSQRCGCDMGTMSLERRLRILS